MANTGTPITMPTTPNKLAPSSTANSTQKAEMPIDRPRILGAMTLLSTCCTTTTRMTNSSACSGLTNSRMITLGTAPIKGPKMGMMLHTPISTAITGAKSMPRIDMTINSTTPTTAESITLPT